MSPPDSYTPDKFPPYYSHPNTFATTTLERKIMANDTCDLYDLQLGQNMAIRILKAIG